MSQLSLRVRMVVVFGVLITAVAGFMVEFFPARMAEQARAQTELRARTMTQVIASAVAPALELDDAAHASKVLAWLASSPDAVRDRARRHRRAIHGVEPGPRPGAPARGGERDRG